MAIPVWWRRLDRLAVVYFWAATLSSVVVGLVVTLPENYKVYGPGQLLLRYVIFLYLVLNVLGNYVQCVRHQSIVPPIELPLPLPRDWKHCMFCQAYVPPRARHCVTCSACILRRERHCTLTACCVGHRNLRFAVGLSLHALAASLHSLLLSLGYLVERDGPLNLHALPGYVWPAAVWRYAHGWESTTDLVVCILANMHAMHCVVCAPALAFQLVLASDGQTAHEAQAGVNTYDLGCLDNLHQVFGQNLILPFLFPVAAPICGDGIEWRHRRKDSSLVC